MESVCGRGRSVVHSVVMKVEWMKRVGAIKKRGNERATTTTFEAVDLNVRALARCRLYKVCNQTHA